MSEWSHLPNAQHIDRVLASVERHPQMWHKALDSAWNAAYGAAYDAARCVSRVAAYDATYDATRDAARNAAWVATRDATWDAARIASRGAVWGAILALVAYDDSAKYLSMTSDQLQVWALLSERPAAVLLLPAAIALERIRETEKNYEQC